MSTIEITILISTTAFLSSLLTLFFSWLLYRVVLRKSIDQELNEIGDMVKERMQAGVTEAAQDLLPEFRREVSEGFKEAMADTLSGDVVHRTAMNVAKNSGDIVEQGLNMLLGRQSDKK